MKICIVGLGSIGNRHLYNLVEIFKERKMEYCIHALRHDKKTEIIQEGIERFVYTPEEMPEDYDIIFITNPTNLHFETIKMLAAKTRHMFIEKPLFENVDYRVEELPLSAEGIYYVACPLRYTPVIRFLKEKLKNEPVYAVRAIASSYLPEWRKGRDYREIYSSKRLQGGGVALDLIHEWDYLTFLFGLPEKEYYIGRKISDLEIDSDDIAVYLAEYKDKVIELHLDYFGRKPERTIEIFCKDYTILADMNRQTITYEGIEEKNIIFNKEDMYKNELRYFLDMLENKHENWNDPYRALEVLKIALGGKRL